MLELGSSCWSSSQERAWEGSTMEDPGSTHVCAQVICHIMIKSVIGRYGHLWLPKWFTGVWSYKAFKHFKPDFPTPNIRVLFLLKTLAADWQTSKLKLPWNVTSNVIQLWSLGFFWLSYTLLLHSEKILNFLSFLVCLGLDSIPSPDLPPTPQKISLASMKNTS